jgi:transposase
VSKITTLGIDLAKSVFQLHGVDEAGREVLRRQVRRAQLPQVLAGLPPCLIAMEACGGAHYWGRRCQEWGHRVKLLAPRYVKAFCRGAKNDRNDARAICEAARQPGMPVVGVKSEEQQHWQALHRVRALTQKQRTMVSNQLRGLLAGTGWCSSEARERCGARCRRGWSGWRRCCARCCRDSTSCSSRSIGTWPRSSGRCASWRGRARRVAN